MLLIKCLYTHREPKLLQNVLVNDEIGEPTESLSDAKVDGSDIYDIFALSDKLLTTKCNNVYLNYSTNKSC